MKILEGYNEKADNKVCRLNKTLYGLKQSSRQWNKEFSKKLVEFGFLQSINDNCLFILKKRFFYCFISVCGRHTNSW